MHFLTACVIARNEAPYLNEFISFHILQGVQHFYFYENDSSDNTKKILKSWEKRGRVTLNEMLIMPVQFKAYQHFLDNYRVSSEWTAFIDVDEFLFCPDGNDIHTYLKKLPEDAGGVAVRWRLFGSNGHKDYSPLPVIQRFTKRASGVNKHCKTITRNKFVERVGKNPHAFPTISRDNAVVDENGKPLPEEYAIMEGQTAHKIAINHYHTKSKKEYWNRKSLPDSGTGIVRDEAWREEMFKCHDRNEVEDRYLAEKYGKIMGYI